MSSMIFRQQAKTGSRRFMDRKSVNILHFGDPTENTGRSVRKYRRSAFACTSMSQQLRDMSKSNPEVKPMRPGVGAILD